MTYTIELDEQYGYMNSRHWGTVTLDDIQGMVNQGLHMIEQSKHFRLHLVLDMSDVTDHPYNIPPMMQILYPLFSSERFGWWIMIGVGNPMSRFVIERLARLIGVKLKILDSHAEAMSFLQEAA